MLKQEHWEQEMWSLIMSRNYYRELQQELFFITGAETRTVIQSEQCLRVQYEQDK